MGRMTAVMRRGIALRGAGVAAVVLGMIGTAGTAQADGCKVVNYGTMPVQLVNGRATTMVQINGHDTRFILDTGAFYNTMSRANADALNLNLEMAPMGMTMGGIGGSSGLNLTHVKDFGILDAHLRNIEFLVGGSDMGMGLLGANLLDLADLDLDLAQGKLSLVKATGCQKMSMAYWAKDGNFNEIKLLPDRGPLDRSSQMTVMVNGKPVKAELDTGAPSTLISRRAAERAGIDLTAASVKPGGSAGGFGRKHYDSWIARVALYQVGTESIQNSRMTVIDGAIDERSSEPIEMLLGLDFILSHHIWVANSQRKIYFSYNGGRVSAHDQLSEMSPASAAAASTPAPDGKDEPTTAQAYGLRGQARLARGDAPGAIEDLDKAIAMAPEASTSAYLYYARARARMVPQAVPGKDVARVQASSFTGALADLDSSLRLAPDRTDVLLMRARLRLLRRERGKAEEDIVTLRRLVPAGSAQVEPLSSLLIETDQPAAALPLLDDWMRLHPEDGHVGEMLNLRCWARGLANTMLEEAALDCRKAIKRDGAGPAVLDSQALVELRLGHWQAALDGYGQALAKLPGGAWARYGQALAKLHLGQADPKMAEAGKAELAAVTASNPLIVERAQRLGLTPP